jgi:hypothetical protein
MPFLFQEEYTVSKVFADKLRYGNVLVEDGRIVDHTKPSEDEMEVTVVFQDHTEQTYFCWERVKIEDEQ